VSKPILQALVLADQVYQDKNTDKFIIAGIFKSLHVRKKTTNEKYAELPQALEDIPGGLCKMKLSQTWSVGSPCAYISLTNIRGRLPCELRYVDLNDYKVLLCLPFEIEGNNPLDTIELGIRLPLLPAPRPGTYALELLSDNEVLGSHRITVLEKTTTCERAGEEDQ